MMEKIEAVLYSPPVKNFVFTHPFLAWGLLALVLTSLMLVPILWKWPKAKRTK